MSRVWFIIKRELQGYFNSAIAYICLTVFLVLINWLFWRVFFIENQAQLRGFFGFIPWIFLFFMPAITMRLWAEEKRQGTFEVLMTLPVNDFEIVLGKFLASFILMITALVLTLPLPITVASLGNLDWGIVTGGYVGLLFMGAAYISIGLFASSLTVNQIVAFIFGVIISFSLVIVGQDLVLFSLPSWLAPVFEYISIGKHFDSIARGVIDTRDLIYYFSVIFFFLYLNILSLESRKWR